MSLAWWATIGTRPSGRLQATTGAERCSIPFLGAQRVELVSAAGRTIIGSRASRAAAVTLLLVASALLPVGTASAAVPRLVLVYGPPLAAPVLLTDWTENGWVISGNEQDPSTSSQLEGRPYLEVAWFWGPQWDDYVGAGKPLQDLRPDQANGRGRFYPALGDAPAIVEGVGYPLRLVTPDGLEVLRRHGVPVRVAGLPPMEVPQSLPAGGNAANSAPLTLLELGVALVLVGGVLRVGRH